MGDPNNSASGKHRSSALDAPDGPPSKRKKTSISTKSTIDDSSASCPGVLTTVLESEASAAIRKEENEDSCPIFKLSNNELKLIFGYAGENQYGLLRVFQIGSIRLILKHSEEKRRPSIKSAAESVSHAQLCLGTERPNCDTRAIKLFQTAAKNGQLEVLKWGQGSGYELESILDKGDIANVAQNGHLEEVKYLRQLSVLWDEDTCESAAYSGHLELLKWARANQCPWNEETCTSAAINGHLELLKWARANQYPWNEETCAQAAAYGHLELLKWARANKCPWAANTCSHAAYSGHLALLKWARANQCPWDEETCAQAAAYGHFELLKWARAKECPWNEGTCTLAAAYGQLELLKWARANQCPWDANTCSHAAGNGQLELLK